MISRIASSRAGSIPDLTIVSLQQLRSREGSLDAPSHVQKSPGLAVHHGVGRESAKGGQSRDQVLQQAHPERGGLRSERWDAAKCAGNTPAGCASSPPEACRAGLAPGFESVRRFPQSLRLPYLPST